MSSTWSIIVTIEGAIAMPVAVEASRRVGSGIVNRHITESVRSRDAVGKIATRQKRPAAEDRIKSGPQADSLPHVTET
jgi:hypothetical protein